jgi:transcriptional regulator with XRE-family HTH domain
MPVRGDTVRSAAILREARLRAGLSQDELAKVSGRDRTVIARYEQGVVAPSLDTLVGLLRACGFDIPLELVPYDAGTDERIEEIQMLAPERRLDRMLEQRRVRLQEARRRKGGR